MKARRARPLGDKPPPEAVREWAQSNLEILRGNGNELQLKCPFCGSDRCYLNALECVYVCFKCPQDGDGRGTVQQLISRLDGISNSEADKKLRRGDGDLESALRMLETGKRLAEPDDKVNQPLPPDFIPCFDGEEWCVPKYLIRPPSEGGRGLFREDILEHGLGWCETGRYRDRVVIPIACDGNRSFQGRLMGSSEDFAWTAKDGKRVVPPKYLTEPNARLPHLIWGFDLWRECQPVVLVEGAFDRIRVKSLGVPGTGALFGKELSEGHLRLLRAKKPSSVTFLFDAGSGFASAVGASTVARARLGVPCPVVQLPAGYDPDELGYERPDDLLEALGTAREYSVDEALALALGAPARVGRRLKRQRRRFSAAKR